MHKIRNNKDFYLFLFFDFQKKTLTGIAHKYFTDTHTVRVLDVSVREEIWLCFWNFRIGLQTRRVITRLVC